MSPEVLAQGIDAYLEALQHQARTAEAFFFGRIVEGMEGLIQLPPDIRLAVDQLIWDAAGGQAIDPTEEGSQAVIASALMHSLEQRMGM